MRSSVAARPDSKLMHDNNEAYKHNKYDINMREEQQLNGGLRDLFKVKRHFQNLLIMMVMWIASSFNMYLVTFTSKYIPGNIFQNIFESSLIDIPFGILGGVAYHKLGTRLSLVLAFTISLIGSISIVFLGDANPEYVPWMMSLARGGVKVTLDICYLANSLIFPTIFAGTAFGFCNFGAKTATVLAPLLAEIQPPTPMIIFSGVSLVAGFLSLLIVVSPRK